MSSCIHWSDKCTFMPSKHHIHLIVVGNCADVNMSTALKKIGVGQQFKGNNFQKLLVNFKNVYKETSNNAILE